MADRSEYHRSYNKEYYKKRRDVLLDRAKQRQHNRKMDLDALSREKIMKRMRQDIQAKHSMIRENFRRLKPKRQQVTVGQYVYQVDFFTISQIAKALGKNRFTVYDWIEFKVIPQPIFRDSAKRKVYTYEQAVILFDGFLLASVEGYFNQKVMRAHTFTKFREIPEGFET